MTRKTTIRSLLIISALALCIALMPTAVSVAQKGETPLPALQDTKAIEQLKHAGQYDSLKEAVKATRTGQADETPTNDVFGQIAKLTASDGATIDAFGNGVAISGETAIVGVAGDDVGANANQGSAYIFVRSGTTWTEQQKLTASDG